MRWCLTLLDSGLSRLQCSLARVPCFPLFFAVGVVAEDLLEVVERLGVLDSRGRKRAFEDERGWRALLDTLLFVLWLFVFGCVLASLL